MNEIDTNKTDALEQLDKIKDEVIIIQGQLKLLIRSESNWILKN